MLRQISLENCIERAKSYLNSDNAARPIFIDVERDEDYQAIKGALSAITNETVLVSSFCAFQDDVPNLEQLYAAVTASTGKQLLLGFSSFLKLQGDHIINQEMRKFYSASLSGKLIILCYQMGNVMQALYNNDHRLIQQFSLVIGATSQKPEITFVGSNYSMGQERGLLIGFQRLLVEMEQKCDISYTVETAKTKASFPNSLTPIVEIGDAYASLAFRYSDIFRALDKKNGTDEEWSRLVLFLSKHGDINTVFSKELSVTTNFEIVFSKWTSFSAEEKWLYFLALKLYGANQNDYLAYAIRQSDTTEAFIKAVYRGILDKTPTDKDFGVFYAQRKTLVKGLDESLAIDYCNYAKQKGTSRICYLTDNTPYERKQIVECLSEMNASLNAICEILDVVYPDLAKYLSPYWFNVPLLDDYFQKYKANKVMNVIPDDFLELVAHNAETRSYNALLPYRSEKTEATVNDNEYLYFVDALGVEFMGFIMQKCKQYDLHANVTICHSNLPSITSENKEFLDEFNSDNTYSCKELDDVKHHGAFDFDYRRTKLPIHITKELEIIDSLLVRARNQLIAGDIKKVVVISDHGASRLAVIADKVLVDIDVDVKGLHSGRCCKYENSIPSIEYATEERGYYVLANYYRFKGSRAAGVETHGGATLEEVIVPIIELTLNKELTEVKLVNTVIKVSFKNIAEIKLFSKTKLENVAVRVGDKYYSGTTEDYHTYSFVMPDVKKAGTYYANVYDDNNLIAESLPFTVEKGASKEKDLFDKF